MINEAALISLVREAMASGVVCFTEKASAGELDPTTPLIHAFGDFPAEFVRIRRDLLGALEDR